MCFIKVIPVVGCVIVVGCCDVVIPVFKTLSYFRKLLFPYNSIKTTL